MKILFINGSPNKDGNTKALADTLLKGHEYETLNLVDYQIGVYGQKIAHDQFGEVLDKVKKADVLAIGSPMYWHNICGAVRTMLDRFYGPVASGSLKGKKLFFLFQGAAPEKWMLDAGNFTMSRFEGLYGLTYEGMATNKDEAAKLSAEV
ncbi:flavodoxin family protein [[Clostridium] aminophilum]|uniref:flavodoxin family protein n=1 Tax=[Clostridium] aminophilum TaxID=1526 RepID=UPI003F9DCF18